MKLSKQDVDLFFELMWALQYFTNQKLQILSNVRTLDEYIKCSGEEKMKVRQVMYENIKLIDSFIKENPQKFTDDKLSIIAKWKHFIAGKFYIERLLKKYAIFISENRVYGVLALYDAFDEMFHRSQLPVLIEAVLLPFKGKIIYDGLLQGYNIFFGRGISAELKETYMAAKQNAQIIESLDPDIKQTKIQKPTKPLKDWRPELKELIKRAKKLRGGSGQPPIYSPAFSLVRASLELAQSAISNPDDIDNLFKFLEKVERAFRNVENTLYRSERYR